VSNADFLADLDALLANPRSKPKTPCVMGELMRGLPEETRVKLEKLLDSSATSGAITSLLAKWDMQVSYASVTRHRRRNRGTGCACP